MRFKVLFCLLCVAILVKASDTLTIGYYHSPPFVIVQDDGKIEGVNYWLLNKIGESNGFKFDFQKMPLKTMLASLEDGSVDMSLIPMTITAKRSKKIDFTAPYYITNSGIMIKDTGKRTSSFEWLKGFANYEFLESIGGLLLVIIVFGFLLWIFERKKNSEFGDTISGIGNGIWWSAVTMTTVGYGDKTPKTFMGRLIGLIWMFVAIMIISGFTGAIASSLTVSNLGESDYELADFKKKKLGVLKGGVSEGWLKDHFFSGTRAYNGISEILEALDNDEIDAVAFGEPLLQYLSEKHKEKNYKVLDISYNAQMYSFGIKNDMPKDIREQIEYSLLDNTNTKDWKLLLQEYKILEEE